MKKYTRKLRKAVKSEMQELYMTFKVENDKRRKAEQLNYDLRDELHDLNKTIKHLADEKANLLDKIDETLNQSLEISCQLQDKANECETLKKKLGSLSENYDNLVQNTNDSIDMYLIKIESLQKEIADLKWQITSSEKPWYKKIFK